jgi:hypothetical protein
MALGYIQCALIAQKFSTYGPAEIVNCDASGCMIYIVHGEVLAELLFGGNTLIASDFQCRPQRLGGGAVFLKYMHSFKFHYYITDHHHTHRFGPEEHSHINDCTVRDALKIVADMPYHW